MVPPPPLGLGLKVASRFPPLPTRLVLGGVGTILAYRALLTNTDMAGQFAKRLNVRGSHLAVWDTLTICAQAGPDSLQLAPLTFLIGPMVHDLHDLLLQLALMVVFLYQLVH